MCVWWWEKRRRASPIPRSSQEGIGEEEKRFPPHQVYYTFSLSLESPRLVLRVTAPLYSHTPRARKMGKNLLGEKKKKKKIFFKESTSERNTNTISESLLSYLSSFLF